MDSETGKPSRNMGRKARKVFQGGRESLDLLL